MRSVISTITLAAVIGAASAHAGTTTLITGIDYSSGDYGDTETTEMTYLPVTIKYSGFPWTAKVTIPWITISGPSSVTAGSGGALVGNGTDGAVQTDSGMGDIIGSLGFAIDSLFAEPGNTFIDLIGKVKLPTADADARLGTGETDFQLLLDIAHSFDNTTPFVTLGYKWMGDTADTDYNDIYSISIGADQKLSAPFGAGVIFDYAQAVTDTSDPRREVMGYLNWRASEKISINFYAGFGFTDASPDQSVGAQLVFKKF